VPLALLAGAYCLAFLDRLMMAVVAESAKAEFALSDKELFLLTGAAFILIYGSCSTLAGWLLDRFNKSIIVAAGIAIWSVFTVMCGLSQSFTHLAIARAGVGIGEAVIVPAAMAIISNVYSPSKRPQAMGIFYAGGMIGVFLAWVAGGWVAAHYGWRSAFFLAGPPGIVIAILILIFKLETPREATANVQRASSRSTFRELLGNRAFILLTFASALLAFVTVGLVSMVGSFFIRSHAMTPGEVGFIFGPIMAAGMACGQISGGWIGSRLARHGVGALILFSGWIVIALFPTYMLLLLTPSKELALGLIFVAMMMATVCSPCYSAAYQSVCAPHTRATAAGIHALVIAVIGGALTPFLVGALSDYWRPEFGRDSLRYAMTVGLLTCLASGLLFFHARRHLKRGAYGDANPPGLSMA
jgi:MFS family permease